MPSTAHVNIEVPIRTETVSPTRFTSPLITAKYSSSERLLTPLMTTFFIASFQLPPGVAGALPWDTFPTVCAGLYPMGQNGSRFSTAIPF